MRRASSWFFVLATATALAALTLPVQSRAEESTPTQQRLNIHLPAFVDPTKTRIIIMEELRNDKWPQAPPGSSSTDISTGLGQYDYTHLLVKTSVRVVVVAYCPGYKTVTADYDLAKEPPTITFTPEFQPIRLVDLSIRLTDSAGKPVAAQGVAFDHDLLDWQVFHPSAVGSVRRPSTVRVAEGKTDSDGRLSVKVPYLMDDPHFVRDRGPKVVFKLTFLGKSPGDDFWDRSSDFAPPSIPVEKVYPHDIAVKLLHRGTFKGTVSQSFLTKNKIELPAAADIRPGESALGFSATNRDSRTGFVPSVKPDGSFSVSLPPGHYDLGIEVFARKGVPARSIPVKKDVVLGENAEVTVELE